MQNVRPLLAQSGRSLVKCSITSSATCGAILATSNEWNKIEFSSRLNSKSRNGQSVRDAPPQRNDLGFVSQVEYWKIRPDCLRDVAWRQVSIVILGQRRMLGEASMTCSSALATVKPYRTVKNGVCSSASLHHKKRSGNVGREAAIKISIGWSTGGIERTDSLAQIVEGLLRHVFGFHLRCVGTHAYSIATANSCVANGHGH